MQNTARSNFIALATITAIAWLLAALSLPRPAAGQEAKRIVHRLPAGWSKLTPTLSAGQKKAIYEVQDAFRPKIQALYKQIDELRAQELQAASKFLTNDQKSSLKKLVGD